MRVTKMYATEFAKRFNVNLSAKEIGLIAQDHGLAFELGRNGHKMFFGLEAILANYKVMSARATNVGAQHVYMLEVYHQGQITNYCKIGITNDIKARLSELNRAWRSVNVSFRCKVVTGSAFHDAKKKRKSYP